MKLFCPCSARLLALTGVLLTIGALPAAATAATVSASGGVVRFDASAEEFNKVAIAGDAASVTFSRSGAPPVSPITAGSGCTQVGTSVSCAGSFAHVRVDLDDRTDTVDARNLSGVESRIDGGEGNDLLTGAPGSDMLIGGDGTDSVSYGDRGSPVSVTIGSGEDDGASGEDDYVASDVENVGGGDGTDYLAGNGAANVLGGGEGNDYLDGAGGDDSLDGGSGADTLAGGSGVRDKVFYSNRLAPVRVTIGTGGSFYRPDPEGPEVFVGDDGERGEPGPSDDEGDDVEADVEVVYGGSANDRFEGDGSSEEFHGGGGDDFLGGGDGNDTLIGDLGADDLFGGDGAGDTADYSARRGRHFVSIGRKADDGACADYRCRAPNEGDYVASDVENVNGANAVPGTENDTVTNVLHGNGAANTLRGGSGADQFEGGAGADAFIGGGPRGSRLVTAESDEVHYRSRTTRVVADNDGEADDGGSAERDNIGRDIEVILGGSGPDRLTGAAFPDNALDGGGGADTLISRGPGPTLMSGREGNDSLFSRDNGTSRDIVFCGEGRDTATVDSPDLGQDHQCERVRL